MDDFDQCNIWLNSEQIRSGRKAKVATKKDSASFKTQNKPYQVGLVFLRD